MAHREDPVTVSPQQIKASRFMWERFMFFTKWAIVGTATLLVILALFLL